MMPYLLLIGLIVLNLFLAVKVKSANCKGCQKCQE